MNLELWNSCVVAADAILRRVKAQYPGAEGVVCIDVGASQGSQDTSFSRTGTSTTERSYTLPAMLSALINQGLSTPEQTTGLKSADTTFLSNLLTTSPSSIPNLDTILESINLDPQGFTGGSSLESIANRNPYSTSYENATNALYDRTYARNRAAASSGPANVRGGQARLGFELADLDNQMAIGRSKEILDNQRVDAGVVGEAVRLFNTIESMRRGAATSAVSQRQAVESQRTQDRLGASSRVGQKKSADLAHLQMSNELLGQPKVKTTDDLSGKGATNSSSANMGAGLSCCFIFLEVLNGDLPWYVRRGRDDYATPNRIRGYKWMSTWLVPLMQKCGLAKHAVNKTIVRPFCRWGLALYVTKTKSAWKPYCWCWFHLWSLLGWLKGK